MATTALSLASTGPQRSRMRTSDPNRIRVGGPSRLSSANDRERKEKRGPGVRPRLSPNPTAMPRDDPLDGGQPDASSRKVVPAVQALECSEKALRILHIEARTIVAHEKDRTLVVVQDPADLDAWVRPLGCELPRVGEQVRQRSVQKD